MHRLVSIALLLVACGSDTEGDEDTVQISQDSYDQACTEAADSLESQYSGDYFVQTLCTAAAVEGNTDAEACSADLSDCINDPPRSIQDGIDAILSQAGCKLLDVDTSACSSTLGEIKLCLDEIDLSVSTLQYLLTCAEAGQSQPDWELLELPSACQFEPDC